MWEPESNHNYVFLMQKRVSSTKNPTMTQRRTISHPLKNLILDPRAYLHLFAYLRHGLGSFFCPKRPYFIFRRLGNPRYQLGIKRGWTLYHKIRQTENSQPKNTVKVHRKTLNPHKQLKTSEAKTTFGAQTGEPEHGFSSPFCAISFIVTPQIASVYPGLKT
jgi:hypothetical protein